MHSRIALKVLERHLEGAELALTRFEFAWSSSAFTLEGVASGPEGSLRAHIDGLVAGGPPAVDQVLAPVLTAPKPPPRRVTAAVAALLAAGRAEFLPRALNHDSGGVRRAAVRAYAIAAGPSLNGWLLQSLEQSKPPVARALLLEMAAERGLSVAPVATFLESDDPYELVPALRLAVHSPSEVHAPRIRTLLGHRRLEVRDAAMVTALHMGLSHGWALCRALALDRAAPHPLAMVLVAGLGEPSQHHDLAALRPRGSHTAPMLRALGFAGNVALVPVLLDYVMARDEGIADAAREALAVLLGPEVDEIVASGGAAALAPWWNDADGRWDARQRILGGLPATRGAFAQALLEFPTRRRFFTALLLSVRTAGEFRVATRAVSAVQRAQIGAITRRLEQPGERWLREFTDF